MVALEGLELAARNDDVRVADAVVYSLLVISLDKKLREVLCVLRTWLDQDTKSKDRVNPVPFVATVAFLAFGDAYTGLSTQGAGGDTTRTEDQFLALLADDSSGECQGMVQAALNRSLEYGLVEQALAVIKGWARETEQSDTLRWAVCNLVTGWYMDLWNRKHQIGMNRVLNEMKKWAADESRAVRMASAAARAEIDRRVRTTSVPLTMPRIVFEK